MKKRGRWRQGSQSVCDLLHAAAAGSRSPPPALQRAPLQPPLFFCVLISSYSGLRWCWWWWGGGGLGRRGLSPALLSSALCATGVYMSAADVERGLREKESEAGKLFRLIPATPHLPHLHPPALRPPSLPLTCSSPCWAFQCRRGVRTCVWLGPLAGKEAPSSNF